MATAITMLTEHKDTILSIFNTIGTVVSGIAQGIMVVFDGAKVVLGTFTTWLSENFGAQFAELGVTIGALFTTISQFLKSFSAENKPALDAFLFVMVATWETIKLVVESVI